MYSCWFASWLTCFFQLFLCVSVPSSFCSFFFLSFLFSVFLHVVAFLCKTQLPQSYAVTYVTIQICHCSRCHLPCSSTSHSCHGNSLRDSTILNLKNSACTPRFSCSACECVLFRSFVLFHTQCVSPTVPPGRRIKCDLKIHRPVFTQH